MDIMRKILLCTIVCSYLFIQNLFPQNLELIGYLDVHQGEFVNDVWGYVDPSDGKEYAVVGGNGIEIIDVTDPQNPHQVFNSNSLPGFDMKVWQNYLYLVTGSSGANLGKILDITDPSNPSVIGSFNSSHNIFISEDGYLFAESPGLVIYNLNNTPAAPEFVWSDGTGGGHDATVIGNMIYDFHGSETNIYQFSASDNFSIQLLGSITTPQIQYHHSGWITDDERYLFICDEGANHPTPDITVWDISNLSEPVKVDEYADPDATVHNLYIIDDYAYVSYYTAGFRIFDVSDPENIKVAAHYDTSPATGQGFNGAFGVYPFLPSGNILISDQTGLYIFKFGSVSGTSDRNNFPSSFKLLQNYPNPFNPSTTISFNMPYQSYVSLKIYDVIGNEVAVLLQEEKPAGIYNIEFSAKGLSSGVYFYEIRTSDFSGFKKMILLR
jgi:choice-of-anchor B domain-containing protein